MKLVCSDLPGPGGDLVAFPDGFRVFGAETSTALAENGMMLALAPEHAARLIQRGERQAAADDVAPAVGR